MKLDRYLTFNLAFALLMGVGGAALAQENIDTQSQVSTKIETDGEQFDSVSGDNSHSLRADGLIVNDEFGVAKEANARGYDLSNDDIKNEKDAVKQIERSITGRDEFDPNRISLSYSLQESIDKALSDNPRMRIAIENIEQARAKYRQARAFKNVQFVVSNTTTYQDKRISSGITAINNWSDQLAASLRKVLTTFGNVENSIAAAYLNIGVEELNRKALERDIEHQVKVAFINRLKADANVDVALLNLGLTKESLDDSNKMYKQGVMAKYDVIQSSLQVVEAEEQVATAYKNVDDCNAAMLELLNYDWDGNSNVKLNVKDPGDIVIDEENCSISSLKSLAARHRYELSALDREREVLQKMRASAESSTLPEISLSADYIFTPGYNSTITSNYQLNLHINWNAWDGGTRRAKIAEIDSQLRSLDASREQLLNQIYRDVERSLFAFKLTDVTMRTAKKRVEAAWIFHDMARQRFLNGLGTSLEVRSALTSLNEAREAYITARCDRELAFIDLEYQVGMDFPNRRLAVTPDMLKDEPER